VTGADPIGPGSVGLAAAFESMALGVYITDVAGRATHVNPAAARLLGFSVDDMLGRELHDLIHSRTRDGAAYPVEECPLLGVLRAGVFTRSDEDVFWRADGTPLDVSWVSAPILAADGRIAGAVVAFADATVRHLEADRLRAQREALTEQNERLALLGRISEALTVLDVDEALHRLVRLSIGWFADCCVVDFADGSTVTRVAFAHADPAAHPDGDYLRSMPPVTPDSTGSLARALVTGRPQAAGVDTATADSADPLDREQRRLFATVGAEHAVVLPLSARHSVLGAVTWMRCDRDRPFTEHDLDLATEVARRAALAVDNARMYDQQRRAAEILQRSLLTVLPELAQLQITARYLPATEGAEVGGDWYDAFVLPDGTTNLVIGDILGHDLASAAKMGQLRNMLRGLAADRLEPPHRILTRLDQAIDALGVGALATCLLARLERPADAGADDGRRLLRWSNAGHLPPAVVDADGGVRLLDEPTDLMLGVDSGTDRVDRTAELAAGQTLWLFTDGLVERHDQPLDHGLTRLRRALNATVGQSLEEACDALVERMLPDAGPDDVAVLAVRAVAAGGQSPPAARPEPTA
jgi:PAS domain S-box-containing protein